MQPTNLPHRYPVFMRRKVLVASCVVLAVGSLPGCGGSEKVPVLGREVPASPSSTTTSTVKLPPSIAVTTSTTVRVVTSSTQRRTVVRVGVSPTTAPPTTPAGQLRSLGTFTATCYHQGSTTSTGAPAQVGDIAVDPRVIPYGTKLYVPDYGNGVANDTGGAIKGHRIDVYGPSEAWCVQYGAHSVEVFARG